MFDHPGTARDRPGAPAQGPAGGNVFRGIIAELADRVSGNMDELERSLKAETIHELRVDITTLRDALSALPAGLSHHRIKTLRRDLKRLKRRLAAAREWEVFIDKHDLSHDKLFANGAVQLLAAHSHALHLQALGEVSLALRCREGAALRLSLDALRAKAADHPAIVRQELRHGRLQRKAAAILDAQRAQVSKRARHLDALSLADLHRLRIEVRRLRHLCELLRPLLGEPPADAYINALTDMQSTLGAIQDGVSAQRLVSTLTSELGDKARVAGNNIHLEHGSRLKHLRKRLHGQWRAFKSLGRFWRPADQASG